MSPRLIPPRLRPAEIWAQHVVLVLGVLRDALILMHSEVVESDEALRCDMWQASEPDLNRELFFRLRRVNLARFAADPATALCNLPQPEAPNLPSADDPVASPREKKVPDFQVTWLDAGETDPHRVEKVFAIECKRLGAPVTPSWVFNENYVRNGVRRFIAETHLYGRDSADGAMVGYVQSQDYRAVFAEVNQTALAERLPPLEEPAHVGGAPTFEPGHLIQRTLGHSPYRLHHLWVDLRARPVGA